MEQGALPCGSTTIKTKTIMWTQCTFKKAGQETFTQGWIEAKVAKVGRSVQLKEYGEDFWEITSTGITQEEDPSLKARTWNNNI